MRVGVPREIKRHEYRVGLVPAGAARLVALGHEVFVETGAGEGIGCDDAAYLAAGAQVVASAAEVWERAELVVKVKEPQPAEIRRLRRDHVLFTYLHLAADVEQAKGLMQSGATAIAYETVTDARGGLPLLTPMSEIAGRLAVQVGAQALLNPSGGRGVLLGGISGAPSAEVVILGGGVAGAEAADVAIGMGGSVCVLDLSPPRLRELEQRFGSRALTLVSTPEAIEERVLRADLVIGTVLVPGAAAPKLVTRDLVRRMRRGSVLVDVSIDQGGCFETSRPTTHDEPTFVLDGVVHYAVANMPGAVAATSTAALTNVTLPFVERLCELGWERALAQDADLRNGLNIYDGNVHHPAVARAIGMPCHPWSPPAGASAPIVPVPRRREPEGGDAPAAHADAARRIQVESPFFEDLVVGQVCDDVPAVTLTEGLAAFHGALTGDRLRLPLDAELSRRVTGRDATLAHPNLVCNVAIGQTTPPSGRVLGNLFYRGLLLQRPVFLGDTLRTTTRVVASRQNRTRADRAATGMAVLEIHVENQRGETVLHFWRCPMLPCRDPQADTGHADSLDVFPAELELERIERCVPEDWDLGAFRRAVPGAHFADVEPGVTWVVGSRDTVTSAPELARLTLNVAGAHTDAAASHYGRRLVYGGHTISIASAQMVRALPNLVTLLGWRSCDHTAPVFEGDLLRTELRVDATHPRAGGGGLLDLHARVFATRGGSAPEPEEDVPVLDWRAIALMA